MSSSPWCPVGQSLAHSSHPHWVRSWDVLNHHGMGSLARGRGKEGEGRDGRRDEQRRRGERRGDKKWGRKGGERDRVKGGQEMVGEGEKLGKDFFPKWEHAYKHY